MRLNLKTAPTLEPISLDEAKLHLKVDSADDNPLITALITTARQLAEKETKRAFITQTLEMYLDKAEPEIEIPKPPLQSVEAIRAISSVSTTVDENTDKDQPVLKVASTTGLAIGDSVIINRDGERKEEKVIEDVDDDISLTFKTNLKYTHMAAEADKVEKYTLVSEANYYVDISGNSPGRVKVRSGYRWPTHRNFASFIVEFKAGYGDAATDVPEQLKQGILLLIGHLYENRGTEDIPKATKEILWPYKIMRL